MRYTKNKDYRVTSNKLYIFLFILIFPIISNAATAYISVTNTTDKYKLWLFKAQLDEIGANLFYNQTKSKYLVYAGPYSSVKAAKLDLKKIKIIFPSAEIHNISKNKIILHKKKMIINDFIQSDLNKTCDSNITQTTEVDLVDENCSVDEMQGITIDIHKEKHVENNESMLSGYFFGASVGYSHIPIKYIPLTGSVTANIPNIAAYSYNIEGGYAFENGIFISANYLKATTTDILLLNKDISMTNMYGSVNYKLDVIEYASPYLGMLAGYSMLNWNTLPLDNIVQTSINSNSIFAGFQAGIIATKYELITVFAVYQLMFMNHTTNLQTATGTAEIQHHKLHNVHAGIKFNF